MKEFRNDFAKPLRDTFGAYSPKWLDVALLQVGKVSLDIVAFDDYMVTHLGYDIERDGSLRDFVEKRWGGRAVALVIELIEGFPCPNSLSEESSKGVDV